MHTITRVIELDEYDFNMAVKIINDERNKMIKEKADTTNISELLLKLVKAPIKKHLFSKKEVTNER